MTKNIKLKIEDYVPKEKLHGFDLNGDIKDLPTCITSVSKTELVKQIFELKELVKQLQREISLLKSDKHQKDWRPQEPDYKEPIWIRDKESEHTWYKDNTDYRNHEFYC